jgi:hypothetical protein
MRTMVQKNHAVQAVAFPPNHEIKLQSYFFKNLEKQIAAAGRSQVRLATIQPQVMKCLWPLA